MNSSLSEQFWKESKTGDKYIRLANSVGQEWLFPIKHIRAYLSLFQPSSIAGKLVAILLPLFSKYPRLLQQLHAEYVYIECSAALQDLLNKTFRIEGVQYAIFCGSPGKHQKPTLLLSNGQAPLGYCKISNNPSVIEIFEKESKFLDYLNGLGMTGIPQVLYCNHIPGNDDIYCFIQTTKRPSRRVKIATIQSPALHSFVQSMATKTLVHLRYEESDFYSIIENLKKLLPLLNNTNQETNIHTSIKTIENAFSGKVSSFCAYHGDLTPWNSFIVDGALFAFDFEYARYTCPLWADLFHFFTQDLIYNRYADSEYIYKTYIRLKGSVFRSITECDILYISYLLMIIEFYLNRDQGILNKRLGKCICIWSDLLDRINKICVTIV